MSKRKDPTGLPTQAGHGFKWAHRVEDQWVDLQCAFNDHGVRCPGRGTLSHATNGTGPWYCRRHFGPSGPGRY